MLNCFEMVATLLKQLKSGGEQRLPNAGTGEKDAVSPSLDRFDDGTWSQESEGFGDVFPVRRCGLLQRQMHHKALPKVWWKRTQEQQVCIAGGRGKRIAGGDHVCDGGGPRR